MLLWNKIKDHFNQKIFVDIVEIWNVIVSVVTAVKFLSGAGEIQ